MAAVKTPVDSHPSQETRNLHPVDRWLRDHQFRVHLRPRKGPDTWVRDGRVYTAAQALAIADGEAEAKGVGA